MKPWTRSESPHPARSPLIEIAIVAALLAFGSMLVAQELSGRPASSAVFEIVD